MKNQINQYACQKCGGVINTVDRDDGTTPMTLTCRFTYGCTGMMMSAFYRVDQSLTPDYEWYKPTGKVKAKGGLRDYVRAGGLLIRPVGKAS